MTEDFLKWATILVGIIGVGGLGTVVGAWISARTPKKGERENALVDQLQEMVDRGDQREKDAQAREQESQQREASLLNYIWTLQRHINTNQPPPPPPWPADLIAR